jgi:hypothetical protein
MIEKLRGDDYVAQKVILQVIDLVFNAGYIELVDSLQGDDALFDMQ